MGLLQEGAAGCSGSRQQASDQWICSVATRSVLFTIQNYFPTDHVYLLFCTCSILDILRKEARVLEGLQNLGIKGEHQGKLLRLPVNTVDDSYALDIRHPAIMVSLVKKLYYFCLCKLHSCSPLLCVLTPGCKLLDQSSCSCCSLEPARNFSYSLRCLPGEAIKLKTSKLSLWPLWLF